MVAKLYIEGGGEGRDLGVRFREGWSKFFKSAGLASKTKVVRGGGRRSTFKLFVTATENNRPNEIPILLVDSEDPVASGHTVWQHLFARKYDGWKRPSNADDDQAFLMVQAMETWFLADRDALRKYFGRGFRQNALKQWPDLEAVPKPTVLDALKRATAECPKHYAKGKVSFELLAHIDFDLVATACPHAEALLKRLRQL